jgi:PhnB protein
MISLTPFLLFENDTCAEAMAFYQSCLGGELTSTRVGDMPTRDQVPPELHHKVAHAHLKSGAIEFSATDWQHLIRTTKQGNTVALYINGGTYSQLREIFDQLAAGADTDLLDDLHDLPFGTYGHLEDKYGVHWFFQGGKAGGLKPRRQVHTSIPAWLWDGQDRRRGGGGGSRHAGALFMRVSLPPPSSSVWIEY